MNVPSTNLDKEVAHRVVNAVALEMGVKPQNILRQCKKIKPSMARKMVFYMLRFRYNFVLKQIAMFTNQRQNTASQGSLLVKRAFDQIGLKADRYRDGLARVMVVMANDGLEMPK